MAGNIDVTLLRDTSLEDVSGGYCKTAVSRWPFSQILKQ